MRHRLLVASLFTLLALTSVALPAEGRPLPSAATATATFTDNGGCSVTVTYTWSGFSGRNLTAEYAVAWAGEYGVVFGIPVQAYPVSGSGTTSHTFDLSGHGSHNYYGRGRLLTTKGKELSGSHAVSSSSADLNCEP